MNTLGTNANTTYAQGVVYIFLYVFALTFLTLGVDCKV